jgi:hypothetical protein
VSKINALKRVTFGKRIAEEETQELTKYFVETDQWRRLRSGEIDVVYGPKGSGKSALYSLLQQQESSLFDEGIIVASAENARGTPAFRDVTANPPPSQSEFVALWKLYLLSLVGRIFRDFDVRNTSALTVLRYLEEMRVLDRELSLQGVLSAALAYARRFFRPDAVEALAGTLELDPHSGLPTGVTGKIIFSEPNHVQRAQGLRSIDQLFADANEALRIANLKIWLLLDRLDVAFADTPELEKNALRALFQVYLDIRSADRIALKIFLRSDIWTRITREGFREASHITRHLTISWDPASLLNLVIRRLLANEVIVERFAVDPRLVLADLDEQEKLFYRAFPRQVDSGPNKPVTFDWMLSRTRDGMAVNAPREMIHLLNSVRDTQVRKLETGDEEPPDENLFGRLAFKEGLREVSQVRLTQTLYAEYPGLRDQLEALRGGKTQQTIATLASIWKIPEAEAQRRANELGDIGFFERRERDGTVYWVPFLYRDALDLVQGAAEE